MTTTTKKKHTPKEEKKEAAPPERVTPEQTAAEEQHQSVIDLIKGRCFEMSFTLHGLPKSRRIKGKQAVVAATALKGKTKGIRSSWSMFTSDHPAVKELNQQVAALEALRSGWTLVRSAEVKKGEGDKVSIEGGKRLIWDADVDEFYKLFCSKAKEIDLAAERVQHAMDHETKDADDEVIPSIKDMDRENAGEAWEESAYPKDVRLVVGVAKERNPDGTVALDDEGEPKYVIRFDEYHVSEKLPQVLRERAIERLDAKLSETVEAAFGYVISELNESLTTFMSELGNRVRIHPKKDHPFFRYCEHAPAEVLKVVDSDRDRTIPPGQVKLFISYKGYEEGDEKTAANLKIMRTWLGPIPVDEYGTRVCPQNTAEKKPIHTSVIEGIIAKMQAFRDKQAKMLGTYGDKALSGFDDLFKELTKFKTFHTSSSEAAVKLAAKLKTSAGAKEEMAAKIADTIAALENQVSDVREVVKRRSIKMSLVGNV